jgi:hypothetical protein
MAPLSFRIRHLAGSSRAGELQELKGSVFRIGRAEDCEIRFDPGVDRKVSGAHAELTLTPTGLVIRDVGSRNGTFVNGQSVSAVQSLSDGDVVRLGNGGPEFRVELDAPAASPRTVEDVATSKQTIEDVVPAASPPFAGPPIVRPFGAGAPVRRDPEPGLGARASGDPRPAVPPHPMAQRSPGIPQPPPGRGLAAPYPGARASENPASAIPQHPMAQRPLGVPPQAPRIGASAPHVGAGGGGVGMNTLMNVIDHAVGSERRRFLRIAAPIAAVLVAALVFLLLRGGTREHDWSAVLAGKQQSVYVCLILNDAPDVDPISFGTAFSVAPGKLATNAHVAEIFSQLGPGQTIVARDGSQPPIDLRIERAELHPGYEMWREMVELHKKNESLPIAFDVALLHVQPQDIGQQKPALVIANRQELLSIRAGDGVATIGFPMEDQLGGGLNINRPLPRLAAGHVSRMVDMFLGATTPEESFRLQSQMTSAGGASGSPFFNDSGRVVGILDAGDMAIINNVRVPTGGVYGQRIDILLELLDGRAGELTKSRRAEIEKGFRDS